MSISNKKIDKFGLVDFLGRGGRSRTLLRSFGDSYSTDELHPYKFDTPLFYYIKKKKSINFDKKILFLFIMPSFALST